MIWGKNQLNRFQKVNFTQHYDVGWIVSSVYGGFVYSQTKLLATPYFLRHQHICVICCHIVMSIYRYDIDISIRQNKISIFSIFFWKFFNNHLHSVVFVFSFLVGLGFVMITLISKHALNKICSELYFLKKAWRKHTSTYPRSGGRQLQRWRCDFIRNSTWKWTILHNLIFHSCF